jgi:hypothetical protein
MSQGRISHQPDERPLKDPDAARAHRPAAPPGVARLLALQRSAGNAAVARMLRAQECILLPPDPSDQTEDEADEEGQERVAAAVADDAGFGAILAPTAGTLAAVPSAASLPGFNTIAAPSTAALNVIQNTNSFNPSRFGVTTAPTGRKPPQFDFNTSSKPGADGKTQEWYAEPKQTQAAYEGDSVCFYVAAGTHKTGLVEGGKAVYVIVSATISTADGQAEGEHSDDIKHAYDLSLKEAEDVLKAHVVGKKFGPKASEAEVKQLVLDTITGKLTHPGLGNDQSKWDSIYEMLFMKTGQRDAKGWHSFGRANRKVTAAGDITYDVTPGTTSIGVTSSNALIKY